MAHTNSCENFEVKITDELGYHLVATRDFEVNDVIITEKPLALGPSHRKRQKLFCVGCYQRQTNYEAYLQKKCPGCGWQACDTNCAGLRDPARHAQECGLLKQNTATAANPDGFRYYLMPEILMIRCMLVQKRNPEKWKMMKEMGQRALIEREETINEGLSGALAEMTFENIAKRASQSLEDSSMETVKQIYALLDVYGVWLYEPSDENLVGFYETASLLKLDCLPNTTLCFENQRKSICRADAVSFVGRVTVRAIRDIKKGEILTAIPVFNEVQSLMRAAVRQEELLDMKGLRCKCVRCSDPTERDLHTGTIKCANCSGWVLPENIAKIEITDWRCTGTCGRRLKHEQVDDLIQELSAELFVVKSKNERKLLNVLKKFEQHLHPSHQLCLLTKMKLSGLYGEAFTAGGSRVSQMSSFTKDDLEKKEELFKTIESLLEVMGITSNFMARYFAESLLQGTRIKIELMKREFEERKLSPQQATLLIGECRTKLQRIPIILRAETSDEIKSGHVEQAAVEYRDLQDWAMQRNIQLFAV